MINYCIVFALRSVVMNCFLLRCMGFKCRLVCIYAYTKGNCVFVLFFVLVLCGVFLFVQFGLAGCLFFVCVFYLLLLCFSEGVVCLFVC